MDLRYVGRVLRSMREDRGLRQADVAKAAGVSQSAVSRAERGVLGDLRVGALERMAIALGGSLSIEIRSPGGAASRLVDRVHAALVDRVVAALAGWEVALEYTFNHFGERGSVDVLAWHAASRTLLIIEVKSAFTDLQAMLMSMSRKLRLVPDAVRRDRGWDPDHVGHVIVALGSTSNREVVTAHRSLFDASFPARTAEVREWLRAPSGPIAGVWFVSTQTVPTLRMTGKRRRSARSRRSTAEA